VVEASASVLIITLFLLYYNADSEEDE
jgi:hypothetical protein